MSTSDDGFLATFLAEVVVSAALLTVGTLANVVAVRDFLLYLDSYDLGMVGTTGGLLQLVLLSAFGWLCLVVGVLFPVYRVLVVSAAGDS